MVLGGYYCRERSRHAAGRARDVIQDVPRAQRASRACRWTDRPKGAPAGRPAGARPASCSRRCASVLSGRRSVDARRAAKMVAVSTLLSAGTARVRAVMREGERVTPLELFFDLVFVLALTQCTTLIAQDADVGSDAQGTARARRAVVVLGRVRLADQRGRSRGGLGAAGDVRGDGGFLVAALCVPGAFGSEALLFACAYALVRGAHIMLFMLASRDDAALRRSVLGLAVSTALGVGLLFAAAFASGGAAAGAVGAGAGARHRRPLPVRRRGLEARARAFRRAPRGDHHHRAGRVDRGDRRRRQSRRSAPASSPRRCSGS